MNVRSLTPMEHLLEGVYECLFFVEGEMDYLDGTDARDFVTFDDMEDVDYTHMSQGLRKRVGEMLHEFLAMTSAGGLDILAMNPGTIERIGNVFWYSLQGHGISFVDDGPAGFDGHGETLYEIMEKFKKKHSELYVYLGDDGMIYAGGYEREGVGNEIR